MHIINKHFTESIALINNIKPSSRIIALLDYCLNVIHDMHETYKQLDLLKNHHFTKYETFYMFYNEFTIRRFEKTDLLEAINYMKKNLINEAYSLRRSFIYQSINYSYINALYEIGKYKEAAKYALKLFINNEDERLKI